MNKGHGQSQSVRGLAHYMRRVFSGEDMGPEGQALIARANANIFDGAALIDLSTVLQLTGRPEIGLAVQGQGLAVQQAYQIPAVRPEAIRLLALMSPGDLSANMPVEALLEDSDVALEMLYLMPGAPFPESVPDHDVAMVAMSQSDANDGLLQMLEAIAPLWPRPMLNPPERVARLSRDGVARTLEGAQGILMPASARVSRENLLEVAAGNRPLDSVLREGDCPLIVRPLDSHAGHGLERIADAAALKQYLTENESAFYYVSPFIDYAGQDGQYRKFRVVLIDGRPYAGHMAVSSHWMVHYLNAGMADSQTKRDEEARWMESFETGFSLRHLMALSEIQRRFGMDYLGIDCAEMPDGRLLVFEVDHAMIVHAMDPVDLYPYKQAAMAKVFRAFRDLLERSRKVSPGR